MVLKGKKMLLGQLLEGKKLIRCLMYMLKKMLVKGNNLKGNKMEILGKRDMD
jgi:hypothetical protein